MQTTPKEADNYTFAMQHRSHSYEWIMDTKVMKYIIVHDVTIFNTYKVIATCNTYLVNDSVVKTSDMGSIVG